MYKALNDWVILEPQTEVINVNGFKVDSQTKKAKVLSGKYEGKLVIYSDEGALRLDKVLALKEDKLIAIISEEDENSI